MSKGKNLPRLRQEFTIMAEFIEPTERLSRQRPAVSIFGSVRNR
jgi:hypothetical protein